MTMSKFSVCKMLAFTLMVGACGLPRPGPNKSELFQAEFDETSNTQIVVVDERVNRLVEMKPHSHFPDHLLQPSSSGSDRIKPGDVLNLTIYETIADGVLSRDAGATVLQALQVDDAGFIFIPYAGRVRAAGNSPDRLRQLVTDKLSELTPEPQVIVQRATGDGATVSILGDGIASQGVYPIQRSNRSLTDLMATAGGVTAPAEVVRVTLLRNKHKGDLWFEDIYKNPKFNFSLRAGDQVLVQRDPRSFTVIGATGAQTNELFESRQPSALQAVAQVGGLDPDAADPTGIFVIREHSAQFTNELLNRTDITTNQSIIFVLDLTQQNGLPLARGFDIRDGDTIYVTEAPAVQWAKTFETLRGAVDNVLILDRLNN